MTNSEHSRPLAVVTGASAGLGKEFARQLAERGFDLLLVARDAERLAALAAELSAAHAVRAEAWPADLSRDEGMRTLAEHLARNDRVMVLVNNAGFGPFARNNRLIPQGRTTGKQSGRKLHKQNARF